MYNENTGDSPEIAEEKSELTLDEVIDAAEKEEEVVLEHDFLEEAKKEYEQKKEKSVKTKIRRKMTASTVFFTILRVLVVIIAIALISAIFCFGAYYMYKLAMGTWNTFIEFIMRRFDHDPSEYVTAVGAYLIPVVPIVFFLGCYFIGTCDGETAIHKKIGFVIGCILVIGCLPLLIYAIKCYFTTCGGFWGGVLRLLYIITFVFDFVVLLVVNAFLAIVLIAGIALAIWLFTILFGFQLWLGDIIDMARENNKLKFTHQLNSDVQIDYEKFYESAEYEIAKKKNEEEMLRLLRERSNMWNPLMLIETKNIRRGKNKKKK